MTLYAKPSLRQPLTEEERRVARALWLELDRADYTMATPAQLLTFLRRCPESIGLKYAQRLLNAQGAEARCFEADHDGLQEQLHAAHAALSQVAKRAAEAERARIFGQLEEHLAERYPVVPE